MRGQQIKPKNKIAYRLGRGTMRVAANTLKIPGMTFLCRYTFLGACRYVNALTKQGQYHIAMDHIMNVLQREKFKNKRTYRWWYLMRQLISIAQDAMVQNWHRQPKQLDEIVKMVQSGPSPKQGFDVAYCYVGIALWYFQKGDSNQAIHYIQQAIAADNEWGYPEYLMGWLGLFESDIDPIPHFVNALQFNWSFFHRMNKDPICKQHPDIIRKVRQRVSNLTSGNPSELPFTPPFH